MLCPEVWNFPEPKIITSTKQVETLDNVLDHVNINNFYKSVIITCPDDINLPNPVEELLTEDNDYYKLTDCSLSVFIEPTFIENFVIKGKLYCLTADRRCIVDNCASITPDGALTIHVLKTIYQTIGLEGKKRPHGFYEIQIDLKSIKQYDKIRKILQRLENFDFYLHWEPNSEEICPSSIAKYLYDKNVNISQESLQHKKVTPEISEIPNLKDVEPDELTEWVGMLAIGGDMNPTDPYISDYCQPESEVALQSTRICLNITKGFITPVIVNKLCKVLSEYVKTRDLDNYWAAISIQSNESSLWQWNNSTPKMFQAQDSSCNIFFTHSIYTIYSIGQVKYS